MVGDLTTLADVKAWMTANPGQPAGVLDDLLLGRLITASSKFIKSWIARDVLMTTYTERYNGKGGTRLSLRNSPVYSISSLSIGDHAPPVSLDGIAQGYQFDENGTVYLSGYSFNRAFQNVRVTYTAGYFTRETITIPGAPHQVTGAALQHPWKAGLAVARADGTPMAYVAGAPIVGQYGLSVAGLYTFAAADEGQSVELVYGYVPEDLAQVCIELVALRYRGRKHIGESSVSVGGESVSFNNEMTEDMKTSLWDYRRVTSP